MNGVLILLAVVGFPAILALSAMWRGYVLSILWGWFIVPFFGAPAISVPVAIGVSLLVAMLTNHKTGNEAEKEEAAAARFASAIVFAFIGPAIYLLLGWIVTKFL